MTSSMLREVVVEQFRSVGLLQCLDLGECEFRELPTFFEVSHLSMDLAVCDPEAIPAVQSIADQLKTDLLVERGVELEVLVRGKALVN